MPRAATIVIKILIETIKSFPFFYNHTAFCQRFQFDPLNDIAAIKI